MFHVDIGSGALKGLEVDSDLDWSRSDDHIHDTLAAGIAQSYRRQRSDAQAVRGQSDAKRFVPVECALWYLI